MSTIEQLRAALEEAHSDLSDADVFINWQHSLLTAAVNALRGPPPELVSYSHHDVAELAATMRARAEKAEAERDEARAALAKSEAGAAAMVETAELLGRAAEGYRSALQSCADNMTRHGVTGQQVRPYTGIFAVLNSTEDAGRDYIPRALAQRLADALREYTDPSPGSRDIYERLRRSNAALDAWKEATK